MTEFLDFVLDYSCPIEDDDVGTGLQQFITIIQKNENKEITFKVYNILYTTTRIVSITPNRLWENATSLLGMEFRYEECSNASERVMRISSIAENSPSANAGLVPDTDFIIGSPQFILEDHTSLSKFIKTIEGKQGTYVMALDLVVYNSESRTIRKV